MCIIGIVESATERIAGKARRNASGTAGRPEGHDDKTHFENCITFGKMWGIMRGEKARRKCKATNRNKHRTFTLALQRLSHSAKAKTRAFRARNDKNRKEGINNES